MTQYQSILCPYLKIVAKWDITDKNNKSDRIIFLLEMHSLIWKWYPVSWLWNSSCRYRWARVRVYMSTHMHSRVSVLSWGLMALLGYRLSWGETLFSCGCHTYSFIGCYYANLAKDIEPAKKQTSAKKWPWMTLFLFGCGTGLIDYSTQAN